MDNINRAMETARYDLQDLNIPFELFVIISMSFGHLYLLYSYGITMTFLFFAIQPGLIFPVSCTIEVL
jgi:hypothetical protein